MLKRKKIGIILVTGSVIIWLIDRFTHLISSVIGLLFCRDNYMQPVDGIVGDVSCGFNTDMYLVAFLLVILLLGIVLVIVKDKK